MSEKHPYIRSVEISRKDGRKDNKIKSVKMKIFTSYKNSENHTITFNYSKKSGVKIQSHSKDYGSNIPQKVSKITDDAETAQELAWEELETLNLTESKEWFEGAI